MRRSFSILKTRCSQQWCVYSKDAVNSIWQIATSRLMIRRPNIANPWDEWGLWQPPLIIERFHLANRENRWNLANGGVLVQKRNRRRAMTLEVRLPLLGVSGDAPIGCKILIAWTERTQNSTFNLPRLRNVRCINFASSLTYSVDWGYGEEIMPSLKGYR